MRFPFKSPGAEMPASFLATIPLFMVLVSRLAITTIFSPLSTLNMMGVSATVAKSALLSMTDCSAVLPEVCIIDSTSSPSSLKYPFADATWISVLSS